jgi:outer membrane lipoprotein carrier protein
MLRMMFLMIGLLPAMVIASPSDAVGTGESLLRDHLSEVRTLRASFTQTVMDSDRQLLQEASGTLAVHRPGKFRWDYREPSAQVIVADGERVWMYDEELGQVTVRPLSATLGTTPAMLLSGADELGDGTIMHELGEVDGVVWVGIAPELDDTDFESVRIGFIDGQLAVMELVDAFGQTTRIDFEDVEVNVTIEAGAFEFTPPPGADVIGADG